MMADHARVFGLQHVRIRFAAAVPAPPPPVPGDEHDGHPVGPHVPSFWVVRAPVRLASGTPVTSAPGDDLAPYATVRDRVHQRTPYVEGYVPPAPPVYASVSIDGHLVATGTATDTHPALTGGRPGAAVVGPRPQGGVVVSGAPGARHVVQTGAPGSARPVSTGQSRGAQVVAPKANAAPVPAATVESRHIVPTGAPRGTRVVRTKR